VTVSSVPPGRGQLMPFPRQWNWRATIHRPSGTFAGVVESSGSPISGSGLFFKTAHYPISIPILHKRFGDTLVCFHS